MIRARTLSLLVLAVLVGLAGAFAAPAAVVAKAKPSTRAKPAKPPKERNLDATLETSLSVAPGQIVLPTRSMTLWMPKGIRTAGEKMPTCDPARLAAEGPSACPAKAQVGDGQGTGLLVENGAPTGTETLSVVLFNGPGNTLLALTRGTAPIPINAVVQATVSKASGGVYGYGQMMRFAFPDALIHPQPGIVASMTSLSARLTGKAGWLRSTSCPRKGWSLGALLTSVDGGETSIMADLACV